MRALIVKVRGNLTYTALLASALLCFVSMAADTAWAAIFKTVNAEVVIEAETYTRLGGTIGGAWYLNSEMPKYNGSGYIQSTTDDPDTLRFETQIIRAEYDIDFKETGIYYLHLRTYAADFTENGFFATMDGERFNYGHPDAYYVYVKKFELNPKWWWYTDGGGAEGRGYEVSIAITETGVQTLALYRRDKGSRIDQIWLTKKQRVPQDEGTLNLTNPSVFMNPAPVADAGEDQRVAAGTAVTLDGTGSTGADLTFLWEQIAGTRVTLTGANSATATFTAPVVDAAATAETLTFRLLVTDDIGLSGGDTIEVTVNPLGTSAIGGGDGNVGGGSSGCFINTLF